jgi:uncharacterized protein (DUF1697 family)
MNTFISMLRGINVSGQKKIRMVELRDLYESLNLVNVETYVQSGNVVFDSTEGDASKLAELIEAQIAKSFGYAVPVFIRDADDFRRIVDGNPFLKERNEDPAKLYVTFLYRSPSESKLSNLAIPTGEAAEFSIGDSIGDKEAFLFCPNGYGRTKLSNSFFERKLDVPATTRNWKTVNALHKMASER